VRNWSLARLVASAAAALLALTTIVTPSTAYALVDLDSGEAVVDPGTDTTDSVDDSDPDLGADVTDPADQDAPAADPAADDAAALDADPAVVPELPAPAAGDATVTYVGRFVTFSHLDEYEASGEHGEAHADEDAPATAIRQLEVQGLGFLTVDVTGIPTQSDLSDTLEVTLTLPPGLVLTGDGLEDLRTLNDWQSANGAFTAVSVRKPRQVAAMGNVFAPAKQNHRIHYVLTAPRYVSTADQLGQQNGPTTSNIAAADTNAMTDYVSQFWSNQSKGKITFSRASVQTLPRDDYYNCHNPASSTNAENNASTALTQFWNRIRIATQFRYTTGDHLVVLFPTGTKCNGILGMGSVGWSANDSGHLWSIGGDNNDGKATLAHELGHNLSFGHGNVLRCSTSSPLMVSYTLLNAGCDAWEYGDAVDAMGYGQSGKLSGSLSSAAAIRAGFWAKGTDYAVAGTGTKTYTLKPMSGYTGLRAVVVSDKERFDFTIEFRNRAGDDGHHNKASDPNDGYFLSTVPAVRVLASPGVYYDGKAAKAAAGDGTYLLSRKVGGVDRWTYLAGETFTHRDITVKVESITANEAVIKVSRGKQTVQAGKVSVTLDTEYEYGGNVLVGDRYSAVLGADWRADSYSYQWYRSKSYGYACSTSLSKISGATKATYQLANADRGKCLRVKVTGKISGQSSKSAWSTKYYSGPSGPGIVDTTGSVSIDASGSTLQAIVGGWRNVGLPLKYQWLRNGSAIKNATKSTYKPTSSDKGKLISVRVTVGSGYVATGSGTLVATSAAGEYYLRNVNPVTITSPSTPAVGIQLGVSVPTIYRGSSNTVVAPTLKYQWLRNGKNIKGATASTYKLVSADRGKQISVKVTASSGAMLPLTLTSAKTSKVVYGTLAGTKVGPTVTKDINTRKLTATVTAGSFTDTGVKFAWQWLRDGKAISKATKSTYTPVAADYGKSITVRLTATKTGYNKVVVYSAFRAASLDSVLYTWDRNLNGTPAVGNTISTTSITPTTTGTNTGASIVTAYQWLRDGKVITGATGTSYVLTSADVGKKITLRVKFSRVGYLGTTVTSVATVKIGQAAFPSGTLQAMRTNRAYKVQAPTGSGKPIMQAPAIGSDGVADTTAKRSYQWYRNGSKIKNATKANYTLTSTDAGKKIQLRIVISKSGYANFETQTLAANQTVHASSVSLSGTPQVGQTLVANYAQSEVTARATGASTRYCANATEASYMINAAFTGVAANCNGSTDVVDEAVQWYRDGKKITGATNTSYTLVAADKGKTITAKVTSTHRSNTYLPVTRTSNKLKVK